MRAVLPAHGRTQHSPNGPDAIPAQFHIKVVADDTEIATGDAQFVFAAPSDIGGIGLREAQAFITTVSSSGIVTVQIRNVTEAQDMLSTRVTIDVGETTSYTATTPHVVDQTGTPPNNHVTEGDLIAVDVDVAGTGAMGLGVILIFGPDLVRITP